MATNINELNATLEAVMKTANEVKELLAKSLPPPPPPMAKAEDEEPPQSPETGDMPPPDMSAQPSADGEESGEQPGEEVDEFAQEIGSMSDEELDMLLQALASEMEKRQGAQQPEGQDMAPPPAPPAAPNPEVEAMKSENMSMRKSLQFLQSEIASLKKSIAVKPVASMNKPMNIAQKVTKEPERLSKSEVLSHLESLKKSGNKLVDLDLVWTANNAKSDEDMKNVYAAAKVKGLVLPTK